MQTLKKMEKKTENLINNTNNNKYVKHLKEDVEEIKENVKEIKENVEETFSEVVEEIGEMAEAVSDKVVEEILPKAERFISTMNRDYSLLHAIKTEVQCCWHHGHWGWAKSILGPNLLIPADEDSEWGFIRKCFRTFTLGPLIQLFLLSFGSIFFPPMGFFLLMYLWERSYTTRVGTPEAKEASEREGEREHWVFVNGMCVDNNLGNGNATQLSKLFNREVEFFHNPTQGLLFDFFECMVGRTFNLQTPVSRSLADCLTKALEGPAEKVVLVAHSQGAIIASNAIELLMKRNINVEKLEVYTFGSAADEFMETVDEKTGKSYPYYEHYAHEDDYVAQIGVLHWTLPGTVFTANAQGHFLGDHYLPSFKKKHFKIYCGASNATSKLLQYMERAEEEKQMKDNNNTNNIKSINNNIKSINNNINNQFPSPTKAELSPLSLSKDGLSLSKSSMIEKGNSTTTAAMLPQIYENYSNYSNTTTKLE